MNILTDTINNKFSKFDLEMSQRALDLAAKAVGQVSPSPLVGCVIVDKNDEIVGEGTYFYENVTHAEVVALNEAGEKAKGGTAYVSLEPHSHFGRTPPCTEALLNAGIKRVVCPIEDPNPLVSGNGFEFLKEPAFILIPFLRNLLFGVFQKIILKLNLNL